MNRTSALTIVFLGLFLSAWADLRADELLTAGGERLKGRILAETPEYVEFLSDALGAVRVARSAIAHLKRDLSPDSKVAAAAPGVPVIASAGTSSGTSTAALAEPDPALQTAAAEGAGNAPIPETSTGQESETLDRALRRYYPLRGWKTSFRFGLTARRGHDSDSTVDLALRSNKIDAKKREYQFEFRFYRKDNVLSDDMRTVTDNNLTGEFRIRHTIHPRWFLQSNTRYYRDPVVNLLHEGTQTGGAGYWLLAGDRLKLSAGPALGVQYTEYTTESGWHFVAGLYQDLQWQLLESFRIREEVYYIQDPWNAANHAVRLNLEVTQQLSRILSLSFSWDYAFEGEVGGNITQNQNRLGMNLGVHF